MADKKVLKRSDVLTFGKYKGKTVDEILKLDLSYMTWASKNLEKLTFEESVLKEIEDRKEEVPF